uniref:Uncharacterized protein n=1 Tax=Neolamprologus brichardi TaxID=32507 RepID=A0A3Q4GCD8_NEOBR
MLFENTAHCFPASVKHSGARVIIWTCFGHLAGTEFTMNSSLYQSILESNTHTHTHMCVYIMTDSKHNLLQELCVVSILRCC